jgi:biofilm PGA synthesis N-glycosyltransferase PgaC
MFKAWSFLAIFEASLTYLNLNFVLVVFTLLLLFYSLILIYLSKAWEGIAAVAIDDQKDSNLKASIVIPIRNEEENLDLLLRKLFAQNIEMGQIEIIFINDHSTDASVAIVNQWIAQHPEIITLLHLDEYVGSPKKSALRLGIGRAKHEIIITTDGDCIPDSNWVRTMIDSFNNDKVQLAIGPVSFFINSFFDSVQWVEFSALVGITAISSSKGSPMMGNGANLAFRKSAYAHVGGYDSHIHIASGDDEFLVKSIHRKFGEGSVVFIKTKSALVATKACVNLAEFYNQRVRWASKWRLHKDVVSLVVPICVFAFYLLTIIIGIYSWLGYFSLWYFATLLLVKFLANILFVYRIGLFFSQKHSFSALVVAEILYPFYVIIIGISALFGRFQWKQRRFR